MDMRDNASTQAAMHAAKTDEIPGATTTHTIKSNTDQIAWTGATAHNSIVQSVQLGRNLDSKPAGNLRGDGSLLLPCCLHLTGAVLLVVAADATKRMLELQQDKQQQWPPQCHL